MTEIRLVAERLCNVDNFGRDSFGRVLGIDILLTSPRPNGLTQENISQDRTNLHCIKLRGRLTSN